jgi:hypothetical protein
MRENIGMQVEWTDTNGHRHVGRVAEYLPKGMAIPVWYIKGQANPKGVRFRTHQVVSKRDDRYIVDCGLHTIAKDELDRPIKDVEYRLVSLAWASLRFLGY